MPGDGDGATVVMPGVADDFLFLSVAIKIREIRGDDDDDTSQPSRRAIASSSAARAWAAPPRRTPRVVPTIAIPPRAPSRVDAISRRPPPPSIRPKTPRRRPSTSPRTETRDAPPESPRSRRARRRGRTPPNPRIRGCRRGRRRRRAEIFRRGFRRDARLPTRRRESSRDALPRRRRDPPRRSPPPVGDAPADASAFANPAPPTSTIGVASPLPGRLVPPPKSMRQMTSRDPSAGCSAWIRPRRPRRTRRVDPRGATGRFRWREETRVSRVSFRDFRRRRRRSSPPVRRASSRASPPRSCATPRGRSARSLFEAWWICETVFEVRPRRNTSASPRRPSRPRVFSAAPARPPTCSPRGNNPRREYPSAPATCPPPTHRRDTRDSSASDDNSSPGSERGVDGRDERDVARVAVVSMSAPLCRADVRLPAALVARRREPVPRHASDQPNAKNSDTEHSTVVSRSVCMSAGRIGAAIVDDDNATSIADAEVDCPRRRMRTRTRRRRRSNPRRIAHRQPRRRIAHRQPRRRLFRRRCPRPRRLTLGALRRSRRVVRLLATRRRLRRTPRRRGPDERRGGTRAPPRPRCSRLDARFFVATPRRVVAVDGTLAVGDGNGRAGR